jgi:hypothetical protein
MIIKKLLLINLEGKKKNFSNNFSEIIFFENRYVFHYIVHNSIVYMCFATKNQPKVTCFTFLEKLEEKFITKFGIDLINETTQQNDPKFKDFESIMQNLMVKTKKYI